MRSVFVTSMLALALVVACGGKKSAGGKAKSMKNQGQQQGPEYDGTTCDDELEGQGFCDDDTNIVFCSEGEWYLLDCSEFGAYCSEDGDVVDCFEDDAQRRAPR